MVCLRKSNESGNIKIYIYELFIHECKTVKVAWFIKTTQETKATFLKHEYLVDVCYVFKMKFSE